MSTKQQSQKPPTALTFPAPLYAALSPHSFLQAHLSTSTSEKRKKTSPLRANGRSPTEFRTPGINTGSLTHCNGSAVVRIGNTAVVCGVRAEILSTEGDGEEIDESEEGAEDGEERDDIEQLGLLVPNVELSTGSTPQYLPGNAPSQFAQTLVTRLRNLLLSTRVVRSRDLRILYAPPAIGEETESAPRKVAKAHWTLYIDTLFISLDGPGSAFDAAFVAILAALKNTKLPRAYWDEEAECVLCEDDPAQVQRLNLRGLPVPCSFGVLEGEERDDIVTGEEEESQKGWILSDPDAFEDSVCVEGICIVVDGSAAKGVKKGVNSDVLRKIEKSGGGSAGLVDREAVKMLVGRSLERWEEVRGVLERAG